MTSIHQAIAQLVRYGLDKGLIDPRDKTWAVNRLLAVLKLDRYEGPETEAARPLEDILRDMLDWAVESGRCDPGPASRDLLDTELMAVLTPRPSWVEEQFRARLAQSPRAATDWYYQFSQDTDYIRTYRVARDMKWVAPTEYGALDITINLSKPEKDPRAIAAAKNAPQNAYPKCQLCAENEGYAGRLDHPARGNHRVIPITVHGAPWFLQYSPYVYYNEHCICFNAAHVPMRIDRACFEKLLDFVGQFPHYFVGSNADLPIVGGSILSHDHFQGGRYTFAMERAEVERRVVYPDFPEVEAGVVKWPMSVLRLRSADRDKMAELADRVLTAWRGYTDEAAAIYAQTDGEPHNTITPIARFREGKFELDLVLRNNLTTEEFPLGLYHPHPELHHIKKENIGLIEVMGLAVLPARLLPELRALADTLAAGGDPASDPDLEKHAPWAAQLRARHTFSDPAQAMEVLKEEVGAVFAQVLTDAGVYKRDPEGQAAFDRFIHHTGGTI